MQLGAQGLSAVMVVTDAFVPLAVAQATARGQELHMIVVTHPVGGLHSDELETRVTEAVGQLSAGATTT